jgi:3-oxoacyl-[acyl-carrier-protein] synthase II
VKDFAPQDSGIGRKEARRLDLFAQYALSSAAQAAERSGLESLLATTGNQGRRRIGVVIGTGMGGLFSIERQCDIYLRRGPSAVSATLVPGAVPDVAAGQISLRYGLKGPSFAVTTACSSGNDAIAYAARLIADGVADVMFAGGADATVTPLSLATFGNLGALSVWNEEPERAARPFDQRRSGFVMGEGAGILVLESLQHAESRGAQVLALLRGYWQTSDAHHPTAPDPSGEGAAQAMRGALEMAGLDPQNIDYINAHGTGTVYNDVMEARAIKQVFGEDYASVVAVSSTKSMTGHLIGAAGGVEAIVAVQSIRENLVPPTINLERPDPECDLGHVVNRAERRTVRSAMTNSFGFGGHNATLVFSKAEIGEG